MAGETAKALAICLRVTPWSRTSHIVSWLTREGRLDTAIKGAARPKSFFLGQYDLAYTCEIVYYPHSRSELHAIRECVPVEMREELRTSLPALALSDRFRGLCHLLAPNGNDAAIWFSALETALDSLCDKVRQGTASPCDWVAELLSFELKTLKMLGQMPEIERNGGLFALAGERKIPVSPEVAHALTAPFDEKNLPTLLDAARVIGVYYAFHVENALDGRRQILQMISQPEKGKKEG